MSDTQYPVFDKDGKYLYFTASTDSGASLQPDIHSFTRVVLFACFPNGLGGNAIFGTLMPVFMAARKRSHASGPFDHFRAGLHTFMMT